MATATCSATNKRGERCQARAIERGLCAVHSGRVDPQAIGRKGGSVSPLTKLRKNADAELRERAKQRLEDALNSENEQVRLRAAQSLYSVRAEAPPAERDRELGEGPLVDGRRPTSLADVLLFANQIGHVPSDLVEAAKAIVASAEAGGAAGFSEESRSVNAETLPDERVEQSKNGSEAA